MLLAAVLCLQDVRRRSGAGSWYFSTVPPAPAGGGHSGGTGDRASRQPARVGPRPQRDKGALCWASLLKPERAGMSVGNCTGDPALLCKKKKKEENRKTTPKGYRSALSIR